jgi:hypothetical protein
MYHPERGIIPTLNDRQTKGGVLLASNQLDGRRQDQLVSRGSKIHMYVGKV